MEKSILKRNIPKQLATDCDSSIPYLRQVNHSDHNPAIRRSNRRTLVLGGERESDQKLMSDQDGLSNDGTQKFRTGGRKRWYRDE